MPDTTRTSRSRKPTTPEEYPTRPPSSPAPEYNSDTTLKIGGLLEAVGGLKVLVKEQGDKLNALNQEVHGYKVAFRALIAFILLLASCIAWLAKLYFDLHHKI